MAHEIDGDKLIIYNDGITYSEHKIMHIPLTSSHVICNHCGKIYDLREIKSGHRYADCDDFTTPCCGFEHADTREWKSFPDYTRVDKLLK